MGKKVQISALLLVLLTMSSATSAQEAVEDNEGYSFGNLTRRLVFYLDGQPWFRAEEEIDRFVGEPWKVDRRTLEKFQSFPARVRLELLSQALGAIDEIDIVANKNTLYRDQRGHEAEYILAFRTSPETEDAFLESAERILSDHFETENYVDLGIFALHQRELFFQDEESWEKGKRKLIHYAIWPAVGIVVLQAVRDQTRISSGGWLLKVPEKEWRLGWFAKGGRLGFSMDDPSYEGGISVRSPNTEWKLGSNEKKEMKLEARTYFLRNLGLGDLSSSWELRTNLEEPLAFEDEKTILRGSVFARRAIGNGKSAPNLVAQVRGETDFVDRRRVTVSAGLEFPTWMLLLRGTPFKEDAEGRETPDIAILATGYIGALPGTDERYDTSMRD